MKTTLALVILVALVCLSVNPALGEKPTLRLPARNPDGSLVPGIPLAGGESTSRGRRATQPPASEECKLATFKSPPCNECFKQMDAAGCFPKKTA